MRKRELFVELVGFENVFHSDFNEHLWDQLLNFQSRLYKFSIWDVNSLGEFVAPDVSVIAVRKEDSHAEFVRKICRCHSDNVVTVGSTGTYSKFPSLDLRTWPIDLIVAATGPENESSEFESGFWTSGNQSHTVPIPLGLN